MINKKFRDADMQVVIGWVLRIGVFLSIGIVAFGGIFYLLRHGHDITDYTVFKGIPAFVSTSAGILNGIVTLKGRAIIQAGIILLIATPVLRVLFSAVG